MDQATDAELIGASWHDPSAFSAIFDRRKSKIAAT
jgi:hypothetical protein